MVIDIDSLGLHGAALLAGFSGGVCYVGSQEGKPNIWAAMSAILVSTLSANYLALVAAERMFGPDQAGLILAAAFIVGGGGPWIMRGIARKARKWSASAGNGNQENPK